MGRLSATSLLIIFSLFVTNCHAWELCDHWFNNARQPNEKLTKLEFYVRPGGPDGNQVTVASAVNITRPPNLFGLVNVADYILTTGPFPGSPLVGRAHGLFASSSSLSDFSLFTGLTIVFQAGKYNGSSFNILGYDPTAVVTRELPITGGTGAFRLARGSVIFSTIHDYPSANYTIELLKATILHYGSIHLLGDL